MPYFLSKCFLQEVLSKKSCGSNGRYGNGELRRWQSEKFPFEVAQRGEDHYRGHVDETEFSNEEIYKPQADAVSLRRARCSSNRPLNLCLHESIHITAELVCADLTTVECIEFPDEFSEDQGHKR